MGCIFCIPHTSYLVLSYIMTNIRVLLSKIMIGGYLLSLAYLHHSDSVLERMLVLAVNANIENFQLEQRSREFLQIYLIKIIYYSFYVSFLTIVSKNLIPKMVNIIGLILWVYFSVHPLAPFQFQIERIAEHLCLMGGLLYVAGLERRQEEMFQDSVQEKA